MWAIIGALSKLNIQYRTLFTSIFYQITKPFNFYFANCLESLNTEQGNTHTHKPNFWQRLFEGAARSIVLLRIGLIPPFTGAIWKCPRNFSELVRSDKGPTSGNNASEETRERVSGGKRLEQTLRMPSWGKLPPALHQKGSNSSASIVTKQERVEKISGSLCSLTQCILN